VTRLQTSDEPLLITASGLGQLGGFSLLRVRQIHLLNALLLTPIQRVMPTRMKKKMPTIAGRKGIWSMRISQETRTGSKSSTKSAPSPLDDNLLFSTDATPATASRVCM
jgi:cleavage and polyadenylation specificity factor subunit 1